MQKITWKFHRPEKFPCMICEERRAEFRVEAGICKSGHPLTGVAAYPIMLCVCGECAENISVESEP